MTEQTDKIIDLFLKHLTGSLSEEEKKILEEWLASDPSHGELFRHITDEKRLADNYRKRSLVNTDRPKREMEQRLRLLKWKPKAWITGSAVAAAITGIIVMSVLLPGKKEKVMADAVEKEIPALSLDSLSPGETFAFVINEGEKIPVVTDGSQGVMVKKLKNVVNRNSPVVLEVPKGGEFIVILDDSTKVWLNSASKLTYPENFTATSRKVSIEGEAYFKVTKDIENNPFYVECEGQEVRVYGTEFNVRSYPEDGKVFTSLAKGSVSVKRSDGLGGELMLSPGTQSVFDKETKNASTKNVNIETVTGWRHGRFVFEEQSLLQIMYDLSRWYNFDFEFENKDLEEIVFMGSIPRYADFSTAMLILEKSADVKFRSDGDKIIIGK